MRITKNPAWKFARAPLATAMLATMVSTPIQAVPFTLGDNVEGSFDLTVNAGVSWRVAKQDDGMVAAGNGGAGPGSSGAGDDGNINWARGKTFSESIKVLPELELVMGDYGAFFRAKAFYDFAIEGDKAEVRPIPEAEKEVSGSGVTLLDAFVWGNFAIGEQYLDVRIGRQVVNWGEALFALTGGINTINPLDGAAATAPGVEIKEVVLPTFMLYASLSLTDTTSLEVFYRPADAWEQTIAPSCGTFFGTDYVSTHSESCNYLNVGGAPEAVAEGSAAAIPRGLPDAEPDADEYGISYRFAIESLDTEVGLYYVKYNDTSPAATLIYSTTTGAPSAASYGFKYVEDLEMFGISASTQKMKISWQWELSYRPDAYISYGEGGLLSGALTGNALGLSGPIDDHDIGDVYQTSVTGTKVLGQMLGAGSGAFIVEVTGRNSDFNPHKVILPLAGGVDAYAPATRTAWGYNALWLLSYYNVFSGVNLSPSISAKHSVNGISASFREGRREFTVGVKATFRTVHVVNLKYTDYIESDRPWNSTSRSSSDKHDKDFMSLTYSWSL